MKTLENCLAGFVRIPSAYWWHAIHLCNFVGNWRIGQRKKTTHLSVRIWVFPISGNQRVRQLSCQPSGGGHGSSVGVACCEEESQLLCLYIRILLFHQTNVGFQKSNLRHQMSVSISYWEFRYLVTLKIQSILRLSSTPLLISPDHDPLQTPGAQFYFDDFMFIFWCRIKTWMVVAAFEVLIN